MSLLDSITDEVLEMLILDYYHNVYKTEWYCIKTFHYVTLGQYVCKKFNQSLPEMFYYSDFYKRLVKIVSKLLNDNIIEVSEHNKEILLSG